MSKSLIVALLYSNPGLGSVSSTPKMAENVIVAQSTVHNYTQVWFEQGIEEADFIFIIFQIK